ncbi:MAG: low molecular weight phosphotyrosine protein phosphatase [Maritimibacter sp.]
MTQRILFVCLGNICRSPAAEGAVRALAKGKDVRLDSAGTSNWHQGEPPYGPMVSAAASRGYDLTMLRARQFRAPDFRSFDLIVAMDQGNLEEIEAQRPAGSDTPVKLFTDYAPEAGMDHVPDPYYTRDFNGALDLIEQCAKGLIATL